MSKFKVGDKVIGNKLANGEYTITKDGYIGTVTSISRSLITLDGKYSVNEEYFELYQVPNQIHITTKGTDTIAVLTDGKKEIRRAVAKCSPSDEFDFKTGAMLAFARLISGDKQQVKEVKCEAKVGDHIKIVKIGCHGPKLNIGDVHVVTRVDTIGEIHTDKGNVFGKKDIDEYVVLENYTPSEPKLDLSTVSNEDLIAELQRRLVE